MDKMSEHKTIHISQMNIPEISDIDLSGFDTHESSLDFSNPALVRHLLMQYFFNGEHETFFEILTLYINHIGKGKISHETKIPERTIYNFINGQHKTSSENIFKIMKYISSEVEKESA
jgi:hypothetical protein